MVKKTQEQELKDIPAAGLGAEEVDAWLRDHPDFFVQRKELLERLRLPASQSRHPVSLLEHRSNQLRERSLSIQAQLDDLLDAARANDQLFAKTQHLVLDLMSTRELSGLAMLIKERMENDFQSSATELLLFSEWPWLRPGEVRLASRAEVARTSPAALSDDHKPLYGVLRDEERSFLFGATESLIGSAAVLPLGDKDSSWGLLSIANADPHYFHTNINDLFIDFIRRVVGRLLRRHLREASTVTGLPPRPA